MAMLNNQMVNDIVKWYLWSSRTFKLQLAAVFQHGIPRSGDWKWHQAQRQQQMYGTFFWARIYMAPWDSTLDGLWWVCRSRNQETTLADNRQKLGHMTIIHHHTALPIPEQSGRLAQVKDVEFAKAPDFDACLAAVRSLSGNLHLLGAISAWCGCGEGLFGFDTFFEPA